MIARRTIASYAIALALVYGIDMPRNAHRTRDGMKTTPIARMHDMRTIRIDDVGCVDDELLAPTHHGFTPHGISTYECVHIDTIVDSTQ